MDSRTEQASHSRTAPCATTQSLRAGLWEVAIALALLAPSAILMVVAFAPRVVHPAEHQWRVHARGTESLAENLYTRDRVRGVSGVVLNREGHAVAGCRIQIVPFDQLLDRVQQDFRDAAALAELIPVEAQAVTGADGTFDLRGLTLGPKSVLYYADGYAPARLDMVPLLDGARTGYCDVVLAPATSLVVEPEPGLDGEAVELTYVWDRWWPDMGQVLACNGRFEIKGLGGDRLRVHLRITLQDHTSWFTVTGPPDPARVGLKLATVETGLMLSVGPADDRIVVSSLDLGVARPTEFAMVKVLHAAVGEPEAGANIRWRPDRPLQALDLATDPLAYLREAIYQGCDAQTGGDGTAAVPRVPGTDGYLQVSKEGHATVCLRVNGQQSLDPPMVIELDYGDIAIVHTARPFQDVHLITNQGWRLSTVSGYSGEAWFEGLPPGGHELHAALGDNDAHAYLPHGVFVEPGALPRTVRFSLLDEFAAGSSAASIYGFVTTADGKPADAAVYGQSLPPAAFMVRRAQTDESGFYRLEGLTPASAYVLFAVPADDQNAVKNFETLALTGAGVRERHDLFLYAGSIEGEWRWGEAGQVTLRVERATGESQVWQVVWTLTVPRGQSWTVRNLRPGSYRVTGENHGDARKYEVR